MVENGSKERKRDKWKLQKKSCWKEKFSSILIVFNKKMGKEENEKCWKISLSWGEK